MGADEGLLGDLVARRRMAEQAVEEMPEGPRKERAFEIVLQHLLHAASIEGPVVKSRKDAKRKPATAGVKEQVARRARPRAGPQTHVRQLVQDGYLDEPRTLPEMVQELRVRGHLYDQPHLSAPLLRLTRSGLLRRIPEKDEKGREVYIYQKALE